MDSNLFKTKSIEQLVGDVEHGSKSLRRSLTAWDLTLLGIGAIIGTGIFVLTGTAAANQAGPAITMSYLAAGLACAFAALCYAEFASMIPIAGSAYTYAYATLGELVAWMIGWDLILEYAVGSMAVAIGWSGSMQRLMAGFGINLPIALGAAPPLGIINLPAVIIVLLIMVLLGGMYSFVGPIIGATVLYLLQIFTNQYTTYWPTVLGGILLLIVMVLLILLAGVSLTVYGTSVQRGKEAALKEDLFQMRKAIDEYYADKGKYPDSLESLAQEKYLRTVPFDPITESATTWIVVPPDDPQKGGVYDLKSGAQGAASDGTAYSEW